MKKVSLLFAFLNSALSQRFCLLTNTFFKLFSSTLKINVSTFNENRIVVLGGSGFEGYCVVPLNQAPTCSTYFAISYKMLLKCISSDRCMMPCYPISSMSISKLLSSFLSDLSWEIRKTMSSPFRISYFLSSSLISPKHCIFLLIGTKQHR